jgi:tetratricopeptide (TPR) repeat protein
MTAGRIAGMDSAQRLRDLGRLEEAEAAFRHILSDSPNHVGAMVQLGRTLRRRSDHAAALNCFERAATADPGHVGIRVEAAISLRDLGRLEEAEATFRHILSDSPNHVGALVQLGHTLRRRSDHAAALNCFDRAATADPGHFGVRIEAAISLRDLGRLEEAEAALRRLLLQGPNHVDVHNALVRMLIGMYRLSDAQVALSEMRLCAPRMLQTELASGELARRCGNREGALIHFEAAAALTPHWIGAKLEVAAELAEKGDYTSAERYIETILRTEPANLAVLSMQAHILASKGDHEAAFAAYEKVCGLNPNYTSALLGMAKEARILGRLEKYEEALRLGIERDPHSLQALVVATEYALTTEDWDRALELSRIASQEHPGRLQPYVMGVQALANARRFDEAHDRLHAVEQIFGQRPEISGLRIQMALLVGNLNLARSLIVEARDVMRQSFLLWAHAVRLAIRVGRSSEAAELLLNASPTNRFERSQVQEFLGRLEEVRGNYSHALAHYAEALTINPLCGAHLSMARVNLFLLDLPAAAQSLQSFVNVNRSARILRGVSMKISQNLVGKILDEFRVDQALVHRLKAILEGAPARHVPELCAEVTANPDNTTPAIFLLLALRRRGDLKATMTLISNASIIPKRIVQYWDSETPLDIKALMQTWSDLNPGYEYRQFDHERAYQFIASHGNREMLQAYLRAREPAHRADIFRLAYLSVEGGYYADADDRCLVPLDTWVPSAAKFIGFVEDYGTIANNFLAAPPAHPVIQLALEGAIRSVLRGDNDLFWLSTGPGLITRAFALAAADRTLGADLLERSLVLNINLMQQFAATNCQLIYKNSRLNWGRSVFRAGATARDPLSVLKTILTSHP